MRFYVKNGETELGYFEQLFIYKKKRKYVKNEAYDEWIYSRTIGTDELREVKTRNNLTCDSLFEKYFSGNKPNIEKMREDKVLI